MAGPDDLAQYAVKPAPAGQLAPGQLPPDLAQYAIPSSSPTPHGASLGFWDSVKAALKPKKYSEESGFAAKKPGEKEGLPGVSEGAGLAGGLAEWDKASGGEIAGGVGDILRGDVAKGLHRMFTGTGHAMTPMLPLVGPGMAAAPLTTIASLTGGAVGGAAGKYGAEVLGATPEQANVAGDVGNLLGAGVPAATKFAVSRARAIFSALPTELQQEVLGVASPRLRNGIRLWKGLEELAARRGAPDATGENIPFAGETSPPVTAATPAPASVQTPGKLSDLVAAPSPAQLRPTPAPTVAPTPAVREPATILPRLRAIAQQIEAQEAKTPKAPTDLTGEVQESLNKVIDNRVLSALSKEGKGLTVSLQTLGKTPELSRFTPEQLQESAVRLRNAGKIWGHEAKAGGEAAPSIYGIASR